MYTQTDPQWKDLHLGTSKYTCGDSGCLATAIAEALTLAGLAITPGDFISTMNGKNGFTSDTNPLGGGLLIWGVLTECYPQLHLDVAEGAYNLQQGTLGHDTHWVLKANGTIYDPLYGLNVEPTGYREVAYHRLCAIDAPATSAPVIMEATVSASNGGRVRSAPSNAHGTATGGLVNQGDTISYDGIIPGSSDATGGVLSDNRWLIVTEINKTSQPTGTYLWVGLFTNL